MVEANPHYFASDWDVKIHESFSRFRLNGNVEGQGIVEFLYRNERGRDDVLIKDETTS